MSEGRLWLARLKAITVRKLWWHFLDTWEAKRWFRRTLYSLLTVGVLGLAVWFFAYPQWLRHNALKMARDWINAGKLQNAAQMVQKANELMPDRPEPWQLAAEIARLGGQKTMAIRYARRAAKLAPDNPMVTLQWAEEALLGDDNEQAAEALKDIPPEMLMNSAYALRLHGELARRQLKLDEARAYFEKAVQFEGALAINEVPLGLILTRSNDQPTRQRGLSLLRKWTTDPAWGSDALRTLLRDAVTRNDLAAMRQWGETLRTHPGCQVGDMPDCLQALALSDAAKYRKVLAGLEEDHAVSPQAAAQLLGWLNQIGRYEDAVNWLETLPSAPLQKPPLAVLVAEALRATGNWQKLADRTSTQAWGDEFEFLRWAYGLQAARALGQTETARQFWLTLYAHCQINHVHALFAAGTLYGWGQFADAEAIWWQTAERPGKAAFEALGALARHYQVRRDADGQYRVFRELYFSRPGDAAIANNFAFFALLTNRDQRLADKITRENLMREPDQVAYAATRAFALLTSDHVSTAHALMAPLANRTKKSSAVTFVYGLIQAKLGNLDEARTLLHSLPPGTLTLREMDLIKAELGE